MMIYNYVYKKPEFNVNIGFIDPEDKTRWVIGYIDMYDVRLQDNTSYPLDQITRWFYLPEF